MVKHLEYERSDISLEYNIYLILIIIVTIISKVDFNSIFVLFIFVMVFGLCQWKRILQSFFNQFLFISVLPLEIQLSIGVGISLAGLIPAQEKRKMIKNKRNGTFSTCIRPPSNHSQPTVTHYDILHFSYTQTGVTHETLIHVESELCV